MDNDHCITGELREWAKKLTHWWYDPVKNEYVYTSGTMSPSIGAIRLNSNILAIADRIDAEHERLMQDLIDANNQMEQLCECSIKLPKDADGEYIHIGDEMETLISPFAGEHCAVEYIVLSADGWEVDGDAPTSMRHYHKPTVEDVLREFAFDVLPATCMADHEVTDAIERFAPMLRLAGDAE